MKRLPWFQARDHLRRLKPWDFVLVDEMPVGYEDKAGLTDIDRREVLILATLPMQRLARVVAHEMGHVLASHPRMETPLEAAADEQAAIWMEASLLPFMASLGAKLPPLPEKFDAFRRAARRR